MARAKGKAKPAPRSKSKAPKSNANANRSRLQSQSKGASAAASAFGQLFAKQTKANRAALAAARKASAAESKRLRAELKGKIARAQAAQARAVAQAQAAYAKKYAAYTRKLAAVEARKRAQRVAAAAIAKASKTNRRPRDRLATQDREQLKDRTNRILLPLAERKMQSLRSQASREKFQTELEFAIKILTEKAAKGPRSIQYIDYRRVSKFLASLGFDGPTISQLYGSEPR